MPQLKILVCGAGIAGSTLAFWLGRAGHNVTIIERAPEIRNAGLGVDIRGSAVDVIRRMGLEEQVRGRTTGEEGLAFVDASDHTFAYFGLDQDNLRHSPTSEIEIMRSDLAQLLTEKALQEPNVRIEFGASVEALTEDDHGVTLQYTNGKSASFDLIVAADGLGSSTRKLILGHAIDGIESIRSVGQYTAYFSIPRKESDAMTWKWYNAPGRRMLSTRPKNSERTCVFLSIMPKPEANLPGLMKKSISEQKEGLKDLFRDAGWQSERLLSEMQDASDLYLQHIAQVKLPVWHSGRGAVIGDAAYCPSPLAGFGTSLALIGAYLLAGEISKSVHDHTAAFQAYEQKLRPFVEKVQKLPPGVPAIANPESRFGVVAMKWILWFVAWTGVSKWLSGGSKSDDQDEFPLPEYHF